MTEGDPINFKTLPKNIALSFAFVLGIFALTAAGIGLLLAFAKLLVFIGGPFHL